MVILPAHMAHAIHSMRERRASWLARTWGRFERWREERFVPSAQAAYLRFARLCVRHRYAATSLTLGVLIASLGMIAGGRLPFVFLPAEDTETVIVDIRLPIGSTQSATAAVVERFERALQGPAEISGYSSILGQSTNFETGQPDASAAHIAQIFVELVPVETRDRAHVAALTSGPLNARSCAMSLMLARVIAASPPGRSLITAVKRVSRPSCTKPFSITRLRIAGSMLPPQTTSATRFPASCGSRPAIIAASGTAAAPSTTVFSSSSMRKIASAMSASGTATTASTRSRASAKAFAPTVSVARPSASVARRGRRTGGAPRGRSGTA